MPIHLSPEDDARRESRLSTVEQDKANAIAMKAGVEKAVAEEYQKDQLNITYQNYWGNIIQSYEDEKKSIDGTYLQLPGPITWNFSLLNGYVQQAAVMTGILHVNAQFKPLRVPEFYPAHPIGEYTPFTEVTGAPNEIGLSAQYDDALDFLRDGFNDGAFSSSLNTALTPGNVNPDLTNTVGLAIGDRLVFRDGSTGHSAIGYVTQTTPNLVISYANIYSGVSFASSFTLSNASTSVTRTLPAFSDADRTSMTSTNYQEILDNAKLNWIAYVNNEKTYINNQIAIFDANQHDKKDLAYRQTMVDRVDDIDTYLLTSLVSDAGIASYDAILAQRVTDRNDRLDTIEEELGPLYDKRYNLMNLRANTAQGSYALWVTYSKGVEAAQDAVDFQSGASVAYET